MGFGIEDKYAALAILSTLFFTLMMVMQDPMKIVFLVCLTVTIAFTTVYYMVKSSRS